MPLGSVLVHRAIPYRRTAGGTWVEGEFVPGAVTPGTAFACVLFLPQPGEQPGEATTRGRQVIEPTLLFEPYDVAGAIVGLDAEDELGIVAPELNRAQGVPEATEIRWLVVGDPQPFGRPGADVIGFQATLRKIDEA